MKRLTADVFKLLESRQIRLISLITTFPILDVGTAFRSLQSGKGHGKVVVMPGIED